jgi:hypothetical protein
MSRSRRPRRGEPSAPRYDPVRDYAERIFQTAFGPLEDRPVSDDVLRVIAAGAIRVALFCIESVVHRTGRFDDAEVAEFARSIAMDQLQKLGENRLDWRNQSN